MSSVTANNPTSPDQNLLYSKDAPRLRNETTFLVRRGQEHRPQSHSARVQGPGPATTLL